MPFNRIMLGKYSFYKKGPMSIKFKLNPKYTSFEHHLLNIKEHFINSDKSIHKARNELRIAEINGEQTVIKSFKIPHIINRIVYAYFRDSKAKKSYENSMELISRGVNTPAPIGYLENYKFGLFNTSYYLCIYEPYDYTIRDALHHKAENYEEILKAFAQFTYELHQKGVWHVDYTPGNILVRKQGDSYQFLIVDVNRMDFRDIKSNEGIKGFNKLWAKENDMRLMMHKYCVLAGIDENEAIEIAIRQAINHQSKVNLKKRLKGKSK